MSLVSRPPVLPVLVLACLGCRPKAPPAAEPPELPVLSHTAYTPAFEHFDEHPPLVAGQGAKFAAHATDVRGDFQAVRQGKLTVVALRDGKVVAESQPVEPSRPGVFGPVLTVPSPGPVELRVRLELADGRDEASLGEVPVHASEADAWKAAEAAPADPGPEPIAFLKEQQWRIEFRNEPAQARRLVETLRVPARVVPRPEGRAVVAAPAAGLSMPPGDGGFPKLGDRVERRALLGSITPVAGGLEGTQVLATRAELAVRALGVETEIGRARARLERAERLRDRAVRLRADGAASERELEDARFEAELARADLAAAEKMREPYEAAGRAREGGAAAFSVPLAAPIAGTIAAARATAGEFVAAGTALFEIVDLETVWIEGAVPEPDLGRLTGEPRAAGLAFVALSPVIDDETRSARIVFARENRDRALRLGAAVELEVETARAEEALAIPESALVDEDGRPVVFVQVEGEAFERRDVRLGLRSGGFVQVLAGVAAGERVVVKGAYAVRLQSVSTTIPAHGHAH
jgi:RND family efflux transporter MFP subunit